MPDSIGPFETAREASDTPAVRAIYLTMRASTKRGAMQEGGYRMLLDACAVAGVRLGAYDRDTLQWVSGFEPESCQVIAGIISRANKNAAAAVERVLALADELDIEDGYTPLPALPRPVSRGDRIRAAIARELPGESR